MDAPQIMTALLRAPDFSLDETPRKIKNAAKTIAIRESAFIFGINFDSLFFNGKESRRSCRHREINFSVAYFHFRNFAESVS